MKTFLSLILFTLTASLSFAQDGIPILQASVVA